MSARTENGNGGGIGFFGWLCLLFIGLKLTGHIEWSWWIVLAPIWAPALVGAAIVAFIIFKR